jgi:hypothetical protein
VQSRTTEAQPFLAEIEHHMEAKGIWNLEELHERFLEQEPKRTGNARWTFERFRKHASGEAGAIYAKVRVPLVSALNATEEEQRGLAFAYYENAVSKARVA